MIHSAMPPLRRLQFGMSALITDQTSIEPSNCSLSKTRINVPKGAQEQKWSSYNDQLREAEDRNISENKFQTSMRIYGFGACLLQ
jgi:hypothetical protein